VSGWPPGRPGQPTPQDRLADPPNRAGRPPKSGRAARQIRPATRPAEAQIRLAATSARLGRPGQPRGRRARPARIGAGPYVAGGGPGGRPWRRPAGWPRGGTSGRPAIQSVLSGGCGCEAAASVLLPHAIPMQPPTAGMRVSARADPSSVRPVRQQPPWARGVRLHDPCAAAGATRVSDSPAPLGPTPHATGPRRRLEPADAGGWGAVAEHALRVLPAHALPLALVYSGGAAAPPPPQLPDLAAGRGHDFVASNAHGAAAPATSNAPG